MTPQRVTAYYQRGQITAVEAANKMLDLRGQHDPGEFAAEIPEAILVLVRERVANIPRPEEVFPIGGLGGPGYEVGSPGYRAEQERIVSWLKAWKAYFDATDQLK